MIVKILKHGVIQVIDFVQSWNFWTKNKGIPQSCGSQEHQVESKEYHKLAIGLGTQKCCPKKFINLLFLCYC